MHKVAKEIMDRIKSKINASGIDGITEQELIEMKYWACVADCMTSYDYHYKIIEEMEKPENQYGLTYDENGRFYTQPRNSLGQFRRRRGYESDDMMYRDMDNSMGRMYYSEGSGSSSYNGGNSGSSNRGYSESRYDVARKGYEESKAANPTMDNMSAMEKIFDVFEEDVKELKPKMTTNERTVAKNKLINMANMIM